ncbi:MAG: plasmid stabilization protein [Syntrophobacteraceae bacterium CG07_land_8_20_14_0_80_61_8]|nr:MAG: plasmid stabilization protein [Syntrophobacteraceae bacterium CG07_land_8_20_14_0_80_61_8]
MFKDRYHPAVKKDLKKLDQAARQDIKAAWIPKLLSDPYCGEELTGILAAIRSFHFKIRGMDYRIAYVVKENEQIIDVLMIGKRESFYQVLKRRLE